MLEKIIAFCLRQKGLIIIASLLVAVLGVYSYMHIPVDAFPDVTNIQVEIVSEAPGLSPLEIERFVTRPLEMTLRGMPGVDEMRSVTKYGISVITVVFNDDVDIYFARQLVSERISQAREDIPDGVEVEMGPVATAMGEIYQYTLEGKMPEDSTELVHYLSELRTVEEWIVAPVLKTVPGVSEINSFGGYIKQYHVLVSPEKLSKYNLTASDVCSAVENNNRNAGGSIIDRASEQFIVRGVGLFQSTEDIKNITLKSPGGVPVYIRDVADVVEAHAVRQGASLTNGGKEAVGGIVMMLKGENSREVVENIKDRVEAINESNMLPSGIKIKPYYDRAGIIHKSNSTAALALLEGSLLVLIILYLFLRNFRGAVVVLIALPLSLLVTFIVMKLMGLEANLMSLGGLTISIGMIIDATIIQVENVQRHLSSYGLSSKVTGKDKLATVLKAVLEVRKPSIFGELIIAVTFLPILSLQGMEGRMFTPLALTVALALLSSLLLSVFVIPVFCALFLRPSAEKENSVLSFINRIYFRLLKFSLERKKAVVSAAASLAVVALLVLSTLGTEFIPVMDEGAFDMDVQLLPGVSLSKSLEVNKKIIEKLDQFPELETVVSRTGQTGIAIEARGVDKTGYVGILKPRSQWTNASSREELMEKMREAISVIPGIGFGFSQPIQCRIDELIAGTRAQLIVRLFGDDLDLLKEKAAEIARVLSSIEGAQDIVPEQTEGQPYLSVVPDRGRIARYGLNMDDVLKTMEISSGGRITSTLYQDERAFDITVKFPEDRLNPVEALGNTLIPSPQGFNIPLSQLAQISVTEGPAQISRDNGLRRIGLELNISGRDIGSFVREAKEKLKNNVSLPAGYYTSWGGQFENQERAMRRLLIIAPLAVGLILLLLFVTFKSVRLALLVISNLPFALIGGVFALWISGMYLSVPASIGFIVLFGVAVLNGVVLVSYILQLRQKGMPSEEAILKGCKDRLRPVLMTASIAIFSLVPVLFATGPGSEVQRPLAVVVVGGLFTSTFLTLIVIPTMYRWFEGKSSPSDGEAADRKASGNAVPESSLN